jgi:EKC/KEOPS complex subunit PCC1/LAGE3
MSTPTPAPQLSHVAYVLAMQSTSASRIADTSTLRIPFLTPEHAATAKRALDVDREVNMDLVERETALEREVLVV